MAVVAAKRPCALGGRDGGRSCRPTRGGHHRPGPSTPRMSPTSRSRCAFRPACVSSRCSGSSRCTRSWRCLHIAPTGAGATPRITGGAGSRADGRCCVVYFKNVAGGPWDPHFDNYRLRAPSSPGVMWRTPAATRIRGRSPRLADPLIECGLFLWSARGGFTHEALLSIARRLHQRGLLREGLTPKRAAVAMHMLTGSRPSSSCGTKACSVSTRPSTSWCALAPSRVATPPTWRGRTRLGWPWRP